MKIGFVGTGVMGKPMAQNLLKANHSLFVYARHPERVQDLQDSGAKLLENPAEVAEQSQYMFLCLPRDGDVEMSVLGSLGVLEGASPGLVIVDATSGTADSARKLASQVEESGIGYLDAPVSGGVKGAQDGKLTFMVGGPQPLFDQSKSLLQCMGTNIYHVGPVGAGRTLKALNQMIAGVNTLALCEAVVLGEAAGISASTMYEILKNCSANSYQVQTKLPQFIIPKKFGGGFRIELMLKDLDIGLAVAQDVGSPSFLSSLATQIYRAAGNAGYSQNDISSLVEFLRPLTRGDDSGQ
jgi:3-hydroxyisobutyrate dehydrogenase-like beta-hydroxyacid dehydrogenase